MAQPDTIVPAVIAGLDPATHRRHALHAPERRWPETNCYLDLLIELVSALGHEPEAMLGVALTQDFEGDAFTFLKPPPADLSLLYGLEVSELAIFDQLDEHLAIQVARGRLPLVEVDAWWLPDTAGVSYRRQHSKTTIGINRLDRAGRRLTYLHNGGVFALHGEDFDALMARGEPGGLPLFPYVETVRFGRLSAARDARGMAWAMLGRYVALRPETNPLAAWRVDFERRLPGLAARGPAWFHTYAFNTLRSVGAGFELLASHFDWLGREPDMAGRLLAYPDLAAPRAGAERLAEAAKAMQFRLARAMARGRLDTLVEAIDAMADEYDGFIAALDASFGGLWAPERPAVRVAAAA